MFEKEAEYYAFDEVNHKQEWYIKHPEHSIDCDYEDIKKHWQKGAEFGYNKANEWNTETPSDAVGNKDLLLRVAKDDFDVGYYHFENKRFYTNDGKEVIPLAWKEIHYPPEVK